MCARPAACPSSCRRTRAGRAPSPRAHRRRRRGRPPRRGAGRRGRTGSALPRPPTDPQPIRSRAVGPRPARSPTPRYRSVTGVGTVPSKTYDSPVAAPISSTCRAEPTQVRVGRRARRRDRVVDRRARPFPGRGIRRVADERVAGPGRRDPVPRPRRRGGDRRRADQPDQRRVSSLPPTARSQSRIQSTGAPRSRRSTPTRPAAPGCRLRPAQEPAGPR